MTTDASGRKRPLCAGLLLIIAAGTGTGTDGARAAHGTDAAAPFSITSRAFPPGGGIPARYTCDGADISPPLAWSGAPPGTRSLVLIVDDPDAPDPAAPKMTWVHWLVYNLPPASTGLPADAGNRGLPGDTRLGRNDFQRTRYGGPCPPVGRHRYFFKLYALDTVLPDLGAPGKDRLQEAMQGHILAETRLMGTYSH